MATLVLDHLNKIYKPRGRAPVKAVDDVNLASADGEIIGLLGSSGCGKTSTLRMIAGFEDVSSGTIRIGEQPIQQTAPARRGVAMAFEGYALYPPLKIEDNIGFALLRQRMPRAEVRKRVRDIAELLEIQPILERYPPTISAGQQQRASLARALVRRAPVSLLDEPMSQLEPQLRAILRARIKDYLAAHQMTTVFVTHDQTEAIALADRIAVMEKGVLQQFASPAELKERPANLFVASFIGEPPMNVVQAEIGTTRGARVVQLFDRAGEPSFTLPIGGLGQDQIPLAPGKVILGIRPHRITLADQGLQGRIQSNQWLGDQTHLLIEVNGIPLTVVTHRRIPGRIGDNLAIEIPPRALHLFEPASGRALLHGGDAVRAAA
ncbi:carbohydrate ABC transporter ATP-binding protein, CUT1 family [Arboricoccus pini]|uniref:Carbohydrate ABC transporter ATP-binding protein, CUT1 family n=1 Tax=Arboricoccus pini TaxID=1963835 RepID=A0A212RQP4_9PROT|nr:ABC transporter ATP-binding protein [Arboricoccus pini]SNB74841.1 carbohydrate ABC transporter ATP-binding protein, CUT1 family [Arboricoccus pini]